MFPSPNNRLTRKRGAGGAASANTQILFNKSGTESGDANLTWNFANEIFTIGNTSVNTAVNSTSMIIGNSSGAGSITANTVTIIVGNTVLNTVITSAALVLQNTSTVNTVVNTTGIYVSTVNATANGISATNTTILVGNTLLNSNITPAIVTLNQTAAINSIHSSTGLVCYLNATVNSVINTTGVYISTLNSTANGFSSTNSSISVGNGSYNAQISAANIVLQSTATTNVTINTIGLYVSTINSTANGISVTNNIITIGTTTINNNINSTAIAFNTNKTIVNSSSFTNSGATANSTYVMPNGWAIQSGIVVANSIGVNVVTFKTAFTTNAFAIACTPISNSTTIVASWTNNITKTGFTIYCGNTTALNNTGIPGVYFMAFGS